MTSTHPSQEMQARLLAHAIAHGFLYDHLLQHFAQERLLHRLAESTWGEELSLLGGWAIATRLGVPHRRLRAIDVRCSQPHSVAEVVELIRGAVGRYSQRDGLHVDLRSVRAEQVDTDTSVHRIRVKAFIHLAKAQIPFQIDIRFADPGLPTIETMQLPAMLDVPGSSTMKVEQFEAVVAETVWTIVERGNFVFRAKDYYDAWMAAQVDPLDDLTEVLLRTFRSRETSIPAVLPIGLTERFAASDHASCQWTAFLKSRTPTTVVGFEAVVDSIRDVVEPVFEASVHETGGDQAPTPSTRADDQANGPVVGSSRIGPS